MHLPSQLAGTVTTAVEHVMGVASAHLRSGEALCPFFLVVFVVEATDCLIQVRWCRCE